MHYIPGLRYHHTPSTQTDAITNPPTTIMCFPNRRAGHSTSVAHLVENELPLSNVNSPTVEAIEQQRNSSTIDVLAGLPMAGAEHDHDDDDDNESTENLSNRNNLSGSYSNLYRGENRDDGADDDVVDDNGAGRPVDATALMMQLQPPSGLSSADGGLSGPRENVYSNVPFVGAASAAAHQSTAAAASDPSLHVYSNIACPVASTNAAPVTASAATGTDAATTCGAHDFSFGGISSILGASPMKTESVAAVVAAAAAVNGGAAGLQSLGATSHQRQSVGSTALVVDDLDLDDPVVMAASAFAMQPKKSRAQQLLAGEVKMAGAKAAMEMKNVIPQVGDGTSIFRNRTIIKWQVFSSATQVTVTSGATTNASSSNAAIVAASNAFCSPSRMRLLHDTTMIDTALDLDSLDGSSLGNSSQACLVNKTAIV